MSADGLEQALMTAAGQMKVTPKDQITFTGPFDQIKVVDLNLLNESKFRLAYKFRCTRPEGLKFRPGYGMVRPGKERIVKVRCLPITGNPPAKDRCTLVVVALSDDQKPAKGTKFWKDPDNPVKEMARYSIEVKYEGGAGPPPKEEAPKEEAKEEKEEEGGEGGGEEEGGDEE
ncbi:Major sperm protein [Trichuris trichiura]|uniref:Major sperm protein n=1 Tax=Trichuris trichiura TaxID=36087 RepID=A0A077ZIQ5_TRITR|nr:Major sperm protein [Trichuris trichiura]